MKYLINFFPKEIDSANYEILDAMMKFGYPVRIGPNCWAIDTDWNSDEMIWKLKHCLDYDDSIFISRFDFWNHFNLPGYTIERLNN